MGRLSARGLDVGYGICPVLREIDLDVDAGEVLAIVGPNGAGKSTLLAALAGSHAPARGSVKLDGVPLASLTSLERARAVTTVASDHDSLGGLTAREVVLEGRFAHRAWWDWGGSATDDLVARAALERTGAGALGERDLATLSSGERQRVWIALALAQDAGTILLDEPTSHLDVAHARDVLGVIRAVAREGRAVATVLHDLNEAAAVADRIAVVARGGLLACGSPEEALEPAILEAAYGIAFERVSLGGRLRVLPSDLGIFH